MPQPRTQIAQGKLGKTESALTAIELRQGEVNGMQVVSPTLPADQHPAAVYLARLTAGSWRTMAGALDTVAGLLTSNRCNARTLVWSALRYQHTIAMRSLPSALYWLATANK